MIKCLRVILVMLFISACNYQNNKTDNNNESTITSSKQVAVTVDGDPTFEKGLDTVSSKGPHSITRNELQDKNGNIWLATWEGIVKYDGKQFTNYTLKYGLRQFHIFSILEDSKGNIWFGTIGAGVYKFDGNYFTNYTTEHHLGSNKVFCMHEDRSGNIWFGTDNGTNVYNGTTFINYSTQHGLSNNFVSTITEDQSGKLWFGTNGGIDLYDGKQFTKFKINADFSFTNVRSIIEDRSGSMWISCQNGIFRFDGKELKNLNSNFAVCIYEDKVGNVWLSEGEVTGKEMILIRYDGKSFIEITRSKQVFGITEDNLGNIWFGTANGVCAFDGKNILSK